MSAPKPAGDRERWQRVEAICEQALGLDGPERGPYVAAACGADADLRRDVEALLAQASAADGFLSTPMAALAGSAAPPSRDLIGKRIGDFEILAPLGAGGMGVVYRARDHRLDRDVAIKVLPGNLASDAERLSRLRREAKLLATVSHPHVGAIYELIETEGTCALVLELLEGESLNAVLARGPMRVATALATAIQIAEALDHVHQRGVTHRDLKPANVMMTRTGARLVDFGVGKWSAAAAARPAGFTTESGDGRLIGTLNYMSPEQLEGREAGPRSDLFAFGAVVYEMVTGRRAFDGQSQAGVVAAIINTEPPPLDTAARELIPPRLERVIRKCLAKDPAARWQTARDLADELRWVQEEASEKPADPVRATRARALFAVAALAVMAATVAVMGWSGRLWRPAPSAAGPIRFVIHAPPTAGMVEGGFSIAPDGSVLVFRGQRVTGPHLMVRRLDQLEPVGLSPGPLRIPTISPDGESVAFWSDNRALQRMSLRGDPPTVLVPDAGDLLGLDWSMPDSILVAAVTHPIRRVSSHGGELTAITDVRSPVEVDHHTPQMLPGGQALLFAIHKQRNRFAVAVQSLRSGERKTLIEDAYSPRYSPTGHLLFARGTKLLAAPFDLDALAVTGPAVTIMDGISAVSASGEMRYRVSQSGSLAYQPQRPPLMKAMVWVDRAGKETPLPLPANTYEAPRVSPDGRRLAFGTSNPWRVFVYEFATDKLIALSPVDTLSWGPVWSPDGSTLMYAVDRPDASHILHYRFDGSPPVSIGSSINDLWPAGPTADGMLIVSEDPPTNEYRVTRLRPGAGATPEEFAGPAGTPSLPRVSPDGQWVAFNALEGGRPQIFVQAAVGNGPRRQVTVDGGREPVWRHDGRELYFRREDGLLAVTVQHGRELSWSKPALLFRGQFTNVGPDFDVAPDGRFLMIKDDPQGRPPPQLNVVVNWASELLTRVPRPQ